MWLEKIKNRGVFQSRELTYADFPLLIQLCGAEIVQLYDEVGAIQRRNEKSTPRKRVLLTTSRGFLKQKIEQFYIVMNQFQLHVTPVVISNSLTRHIER